MTMAYTIIHYDFLFASGLTDSWSTCLVSSGIWLSHVEFIQCTIQSLNI